MSWRLAIVVFAAFISCKNQSESQVGQADLDSLKRIIQSEINVGIEATRTKDIDTYMSRMPTDLVIYDESGDTITREMQRAFALRDWSIIDTTLAISMTIDSLQVISGDSLIVYTSQYWKRMMFQRDGVTTDTIVTTQLHKEIWKNTDKSWFSYSVEELGGEIYINGERYQP